MARTGGDVDGNGNEGGKDSSEVRSREYVDSVLPFYLLSFYVMVIIFPIEWCIGEPMPVFFFYHILQNLISLAYNIILIFAITTTQ